MNALQSCSKFILKFWADSGLKFRNASNTKSFPLPTYKLLQFSSPHYLRDVIATQPPPSTRSSSVVTLLHPPVQSRLKVTNRSFRCAAPLLWNKLPYSLRIPYQPDPTHSSSMSSSPDPRSAVNISHGVFHSRLKTHLFSRSFPP